MVGRAGEPLGKKISHPGREPQPPCINTKGFQASPLEDGHDLGDAARVTTDASCLLQADGR